MVTMELLINSDESYAVAEDTLFLMYKESRYLTIQITTGQQRSKPQNNALHKYCEMLGEALNDSGYDMKKVLKEEVDIPWSKKTVKEFLWRPLQKAVLGVESTKKPLRSEYSKVYDVLNRHIGEKFGVSVPWPSKESRNSQD